MLLFNTLSKHNPALIVTLQAPALPPLSPHQSLVGLCTSSLHESLNWTVSFSYLDTRIVAFCLLTGHRRIRACSEP